ncbi:MAG: LysE family translocator [Comamonas sp.]
MQLHTWLLFFLTAVGMSLSPGPNSLLAISHGALHGRRKTLYTICGGLCGFVLIIALCMFGIGALIQSSLLWLTALKWIGGLYLAYLGFKLWRSPPVALPAAQRPTLPITRGHTLFKDGFLSAATNPKGLLFFSALLPQFIDPHRNLFVQFVVISATWVVLEFCVEFFLASAAARIRPWLVRCGKAFNRCCGGVFMLLGLAIPLKG